MDQVKNIATLHNLLDANAGRFISAEAEIQNSLPSWINEAGSIQLKAVLQKYLVLVTEHVARLDMLIRDWQFNFINSSDPVMLSLIGDVNQMLSDCADAAVKDACLLAGIQCINHYKICKYGTAAAYAAELGIDKAAAILHELEINENHIDDRLSQLAKYEINAKAKTPVILPS